MSKIAGGAKNPPKIILDHIISELNLLKGGEGEAPPAGASSTRNSTKQKGKGGALRPVRGRGQPAAREVEI